MKCIVCGGRDFYHQDIVDMILKKYHITEIVSGGCRGADSLGERYGHEHGIKVTIFKPDWSYGKRGGPIRNKAMAKYADMVIAFRGGPGTANMCNIAKKMGLIVIEYYT